MKITGYFGDPLAAFTAFPCCGARTYRYGVVSLLAGRRDPGVIPVLLALNFGTTIMDAAAH